MAASIKQVRINLYIIFLFMLMTVFVNCNQQNRDKEIKADIAAKAVNELNFAAVNYTVEDGVVTLTGKCASEKSKNTVGQTVKSVNIVKGIVDKIVIAPVVLTADLTLKQAVDSVLKTYPTVQADVNNGLILLEGKVQKKDADKIIAGLNGLHPGKIDNRLKLE